MALVQKKNAKQNIILLIVLLVVIVGGVIAYTYLRPSGSATNSAVSGSLSRDPEIFTDFGQDLYSKSQFKALYDFSKDIPPSQVVPNPIPVPGADVNVQVDLPPNTKIGNPEPFKS